MSEKFKIKSMLKNYYVEFIDNISEPIEREANNGAFFIVDSKVLALYRDKLEPLLPANKYILIDADEKNKTMDKCQEIIAELVAMNIRRDNKLIAIGGGIIQDITAFIASILYRGINWSFIPTTLLAQADSCIGSKTSINLGNKKNIIGNFYPPDQIYIDISLLETLKISEIKSGIGEILHFYLYAASPLAEQLSGKYDEILRERKVLKEYIKASLAIKKKVIEIDEFDKGERNKFNYGHTFGHAIETLTGYKISHGQAVMVGMDIANYLSLKYGYLDKETFNFMHGLLKINIPKLNINEYNMEDYFAALSRDKKNIGNDLVCILTRGPGAMFKKRLPLNEDLKNKIISRLQSISNI